MKLRKALDKAKEIRKELPQTDQLRETEVEKKFPGDEWQPPVYSESTYIELNSATLLQNRCICIEPNSSEIDCYKLLRTKIQQMTQRKGWSTVMITSALPAEGKTLTAINLALTFSKAYSQTVMLVDCDLRRQNIHRVLGFKSGSGLIDYLVDDRPLQNVIIWPGIDKLTMISGGRTIQNSAELLGSPRMQTLVKEMKSRYEDRYVLFDVPPLLVGADALALAPYIDCIVMMVEKGKTSTKNVQKAVQMLPQEKFLGFVMNRQKTVKMKGYGYYR
jgi:protein-tyrosine kinase